MNISRRFVWNGWSGFRHHKDETDTELALLRAIDAGADAITMIGATGTRLDHVMGISRC